jgi:hypothetical protein
MSVFRVTTPVDGFTGSVGGVTFVDGRADVDDQTNPGELGYFRGAGYSVEDLAELTAAAEQPEESAPPTDPGTDDTANPNATKGAKV